MNPMKDEPKTKKGFFAILLESFNKTSGCCCGPGETCGGPPKEAKEAATPQPEKPSAAAKPAAK